MPKSHPRQSIGSDTNPNEIIQYLPDTAHGVICHLFQFMAKHRYKPMKWYNNATKLIYKINKTDPNKPTNYRPITIMKCILKL
jgi:hypothetical protein